MDLMYGSGLSSESEIGDLKYSFSLIDEMEDLLSSSSAASSVISSSISPPGSSKSLEDFMLEDLHCTGSGDKEGAASRDHLLFGEDGFEEFGMRFESPHNRGGLAGDPFDIFDNFLDHSPPPTKISVVTVNPTTLSSSTNTKGLRSVVAASVGVSRKVVVSSSSATASNGLGPRNTKNNSVNNSGSVSGSSSSSNNNNSLNSVKSAPSIYVWNGLGFLNRSDSKGISFEESCGIMVSTNPNPSFFPNFQWINNALKKYKSVKGWYLKFKIMTVQKSYLYMYLI